MFKSRITLADALCTSVVRCTLKLKSTWFLTECVQLPYMRMFRIYRTAFYVIVIGSCTSNELRYTLHKKCDTDVAIDHRSGCNGSAE